MAIPVMLIGILLAIVLGIVIFTVTEPFELILLAAIGAIVVGMYTGRI